MALHAGLSRRKHSLEVQIPRRRNQAAEGIADASGDVPGFGLRPALLSRQKSARMSQESESAHGERRALSSRRRHSTPAALGSCWAAVGDEDTSYHVLQGAPARALKMLRQRSVGSVKQSAGEAAKNRKSKHQQLWNRESKFRLRPLPSHHKSDNHAIMSSPEVRANRDSYEVGMLRLVYGKAREIRMERRSSLPQSDPSFKSLRALCDDIRRSVRVCSKAKEFIDLALDAVWETHDKRVAQVAMPAPAALDDCPSPTSPPTTEANNDWRGLLELLDSPVRIHPEKAFSGSIQGLMESPERMHPDQTFSGSMRDLVAANQEKSPRQ